MEKTMSTPTNNADRTEKRERNREWEGLGWNQHKFLRNSSSNTHNFHRIAAWQSIQRHPDVPNHSHWNRNLHFLLFAFCVSNTKFAFIRCVYKTNYLGQVYTSYDQSDRNRAIHHRNIYQFELENRNDGESKTEFKNRNRKNRGRIVDWPIAQLSWFMV